MAKVTADFRKDIERYKKAGVTQVKVKHQNDYYVCNACREQTGTVYTIDDASTVPHNCTSEDGCRCMVVPIMD